MADAAIAILWTDDDGGDRSFVVEAETIVGRESRDPTYHVILRTDNGVVGTGIHDPSVSRIHARLEPSPQGLIVRDVGTRGKGSTNGTYINEERIPPAEPRIARPGDVVRFGLYTVMKVASRSDGKNIVVMKPGESIILPKDKIRELRNATGIDVADVGRDKVAVYFSGDVSLSSIDLGKEKIRVTRRDADEKRASMLLDMRLKLVEAKRLLEFEPPRLEEASVKLAVLVRIRRYREVIAETAGEDLVKELEAAIESVRKGRLIPGLEKRMNAISSELLEVIDSLRNLGV